MSIHGLEDLCGMKVWRGVVSHGLSHAPSMEQDSQGYQVSPSTRSGHVHRKEVHRLNPDQNVGL